MSTDERSRRKETFDEPNSVAVTFHGGETWFLPKPWLEVRPVFRRGRAVDSVAMLTNGPELDELVDAIAEAESFAAQIVGAASLGAKLLLYHYDLADEDLDRLLCFRVTDPASMEWVQKVIEVATGRSGPKR